MKNSALFVTLFVLIGFASVALCQNSCSATRQCYSFSTSANYVNCQNNQCKCVAGFQGNATTNNKCRCDFQVVWGTSGVQCKKCDPPRQIIYIGGNPYCVNGQECEDAAAENERQALRRAKVEEIYTDLVAPTPILIVTGQKSVAHIFDTNVRGRVTPLGKFIGFQGTQEYFYGLSAAQNVVTQVNIRSLVSTGDKVSVEVDIFFNRPPEAGGPQNLTQTGFYRFNNDNLVISFDLAILNLGKAVDVPAVAQPQVILQMCQALSGPSGTCATTYPNVAACVTFMSSIPFGSWNRANSNSVVCRQLHTILTPLRPDIHCPHVSPSGGGACIEFSYESFYEEDF